MQTAYSSIMDIVGNPYQPPVKPGGHSGSLRPMLDYASMRVASPVDGINFSNKKELNKQLAKLDQDLRNARAQNDGSSIQRLEAKQQAVNDVLKGMKAGYSPDEAKQFANREAEIRQAQQRTAAEVANRQNSPTPPRETFQSIPFSATPAPELNRLANTATSGGQAGSSARAALQQRAAAGDPQAANAVQALNIGMVSPQEADRILREDPSKYDRMKRAGQIPGNQQLHDEAVRDAKKMAGNTPSSPAIQPQQPSRIIQPTNAQNQKISASGSGPRKEPTAEEMAASMDKQNRAKEMAAQAAQQRAAYRNQAARDAAARKMGFENAAAAEKAGAKIGNPGEKLPGGGGGRGGGGRGGGGSAPRQTAKERNMAADEAASQAARRKDSRGYADSAYKVWNEDSAKWGEDEAARRKRITDAGGNPDYHGWKDNPQYERDVDAANKRHWDNFNNRQKEKEKQDQRKAAADNYRKAMQDGSFTDADGNIKPSKNPDGSASEDLLLWTQMQRPPGSGRKMVHAYGNKHSSVMVAARGQNP